MLSGARLATTPQADILDAHVTFLESIGVQVSDDVNVRPIVTGKPYVDYAVVTQVQVGNVIDTQRRRRNRLTEVRVSDSVSY